MRQAWGWHRLSRYTMPLLHSVLYWTSISSNPSSWALPQYRGVLDRGDYQTQTCRGRICDSQLQCGLHALELWTGYAWRNTETCGYACWNNNLKSCYLWLQCRNFWLSMAVRFYIQPPKICIIRDFDYPKICIGVINGQSSSQILYALCDETYLKISRFCAIISAEKWTVVFVTRRREPHKRLPISKNISKKFLEILLEIDWLVATRIFAVRT